MSTHLKPDFFPLIAAHGLLMLTAWGALIPTAVFIARYKRVHLGPRWFLYHAWIMATALVMLIAAAVLAVIACQTHFNKLHKINGLVLTVVMVGQAVLGWIAHRNRSPRLSDAPWYNQVHRLVGKILPVLGYANMVLGILDHPTLDNRLLWPLALHAVVLLAVFMYAEHQQQ
jgi:hypothetical protein